MNDGEMIQFRKKSTHLLIAGEARQRNSREIS